MKLQDTAFTHRNPQASTELVIPIGLVPTVGQEQSLQNVKDNCKRDIEWLCEQPAHEKEAVICGAAPSLKQFYPDIYYKQSAGAVVFGCNSAAKHLACADIKSDYQVLLDPLESVADEFYPAKKHLLASIVSPSVFDMAADPVLWHPCIDWVAEYADGFERDFSYIGGGVTVTMSALCIAYTMGFRKIHLYGVDSSFSRNSFYVDKAGCGDGRLLVTVEAKGQTYKTTYDMKQQVVVFLELQKMLKANGCEVKVYGNGLLPDMAN